MDSIPKVIHYCWFGGRPHPESVVRCMDSWRRVLPDYRIIEWNETNFDVNTNDYTREAHSAGKFAFVTDYVRLKVLHDYGGIYMDTDVEVLKSLDRFLHHAAFSGFEDETRIPTAVMGSQAGNEWIGLLLADYDGLHFRGTDGQEDLTTNVSRITRTTHDHYGLAMDNRFHEIPGVLTLYPKDYFCPKSYGTGIITRTANTHAIHHFSGTWRTEDRRAFKAAQGRLNRLFGTRIGGHLLAVRHVYVTEGVAALPGRVVRGLQRRISGLWRRGDGVS